MSSLSSPDANLPARARAAFLLDAVALLAVIGIAHAEASPLPTRDQNPLLAGFDLPLPMDARLAQARWSLDAAVNWSSTALRQRAGSETLLVDAETREVRVTLGRRFAERWSLALQLPYRELDGGSLDGFIDNWHDVFGLDEGARPLLPRDRLAIRYERDEVAVLDTERSARGMGDASLALSYQLSATPTSAVRAALHVKVPTGEDHWFTSSGRADVSAIIAVERALDERWTLYGQGALTRVGTHETKLAAQRDLLWSAHGALSWQATRRIELIAQLDAHQAPYRATALDFFDDALVLSVGGAVHFDSGWRLHLGVSEDIAIERSPDVVFIFGLSSPKHRAK